MRIKISHVTTYRYSQPPAGVTQVLRLTPRNYEGQYVINWRIDVSRDCRLHLHEDAFGNLTHTFTIDGPVSELEVAVEGEVDTTDTNGLVQGTIERFPPDLFLRETYFTEPSPGIIDFAESARNSACERGPLAILHALVERLNKEIEFDSDSTHTSTTAAESFVLRRGVCQDITHIFIAAARHLGTPARYIGGHFHRADGVSAQEAGHAWAEAFVPDLGWVAFDPTNGISATDAHVRVAVGLDYLAAAPVRGTQTGGSGESMKVAVHVEQAAGQRQN